MNCKHKKIKHFAAKDRVICLDCGEVWANAPVYVNYPWIFSPYCQTITPPNTITYPQITYTGTGYSTMQIEGSAS